ncbi:MAG: DEAD/DEAH box helicase [Rhodobacteraceae bacterium TMED111]|nr:MAG: DEAD/DEAH box helicase [Rhodobacteraceae bacterium TMED111]
MTFKDLQLNPLILKAINDQNYINPTAIQKKAIPLVLNQFDVLASAQTGTGKTAAFALPIIHNLAKERRGNKIKALIVTPTRELAIQIGENFTDFSKYTTIRNTVIFGGVKQGTQTNKLAKRPEVLIATPGRLLDLIEQGFISLKDVAYFVLDEADRMLDMGFIHDIRKLLNQLPKERQSLFFSATLPKNIIELSSQILKQPKKISVNSVSSTAETIKQYIYYTNKSSKNDLLYHILKDEKINQLLLFSRTKHGADRIVRNLRKKNIQASAIHGNKTQNQRQKALKLFKDSHIRILVATDIAARGIDIERLSYVLNYDIPNESETYVHRIGRCGRAGEEGVAISISEPEENGYVKIIEKLIQKNIEVILNHPYPQTDIPMNTKEKKEFEKQKQKRKQEFFANRNKKKKDARKKFK